MLGPPNGLSLATDPPNSFALTLEEDGAPKALTSQFEVARSKRPPVDTNLLEGMTLTHGLKGLALAFSPPNLCTSESDGATKRLVPLNGDPTPFPPGSHVVWATRPPVVVGLSEEMALTLAFLNGFSQASCPPNWRTPENNGAPKRLFLANGDPTLFGRASDEAPPKRPPVVRGLHEDTALTLAFPKGLPEASAPPHALTLERQEAPKRLSRSSPCATVSSEPLNWTPFKCETAL